MKKKTLGIPLLALLTALLVILPCFADRFFITMMIRTMYYGLMAVSFTFLAGQLGLFSLMVPVPFALSGYTIAILESRHLANFPSSVVLGILLAMVMSAFFGVLVNRSKGTYFLMLTLVLGQLVWALTLQWVSLTRGTNGINGIKMPALLASAMDGSNHRFYYFVLVLTALCILGLYAVIRSSFGMKLRGIRESESRMIMLGYNVDRIKWIAFMISSFTSALAGVCFVYYTGLINPDTVSLRSATAVLIASIFGGVSSILGALLGTAVIKTLEIVLSGITQRYLLIIGAIFLVVIVCIPGGVATLQPGKAFRKKDVEKPSVSASKMDDPTNNH